MASQLEFRLFGGETLDNLLRRDAFGRCGIKRTLVSQSSARQKFKCANENQEQHCETQHQFHNYSLSKSDGESCSPHRGSPVSVPSPLRRSNTGELQFPS